MDAGQKIEKDSGQSKVVQMRGRCLENLDQLRRWVKEQDGPPEVNVWVLTNNQVATKISVKPAWFFKAVWCSSVQANQVLHWLVPERNQAEAAGWLQTEAPLLKMVWILQCMQENIQLCGSWCHAGVCSLQSAANINLHFHG